MICPLLERDTVWPIERPLVLYLPFFRLVDTKRAGPELLIFTACDNVAGAPAVTLYQRVSKRDIQVAKAFKPLLLHQGVDISREVDGEELSFRTAGRDVDNQVSRNKTPGKQIINFRSHQAVMPVNQQPIALNQLEPYPGEVQE